MAPHAKPDPTTRAPASKAQIAVEAPALAAVIAGLLSQAFPDLETVHVSAASIALAGIVQAGLSYLRDRGLRIDLAALLGSVGRAPVVLLAMGLSAQLLTVGCASKQQAFGVAAFTAQEFASSTIRYLDSCEPANICEGSDELRAQLRSAARAVQLLVPNALRELGKLIDQDEREEYSARALERLEREVATLRKAPDAVVDDPGPELLEPALPVSGP